MTINPLALLQQFDGFSPDGLSYSVADDASKLFAQAMAAYDARAAQPRTDVFGRTLTEDRPEALQQTLLDPLLTHFGLRGGATTQPKTYHVGDSLLQQDFLGNIKPIYTAPAKPAKELAVTIPVKNDIFGKPSQTIKATPSQFKEAVDAGAIPSSMVATNLPLQFYTGLGSHFTNAVKAGMSAVNPAGGTRQVGRFTVKPK